MEGQEQTKENKRMIEDGDGDGKEVEDDGDGDGEDDDEHEHGNEVGDVENSDNDEDDNEDVTTLRRTKECRRMRDDMVKSVEGTMPSAGIPRLL
jgi:hypothetical protein